MKITIQDYIDQGGGVTGQRFPRVLADRRQGIHVEELKINGRRMVEVIGLVRAKEVTVFGRRNRSTRIEFSTWQILKDPAVAGAQIVLGQEVLGILGASGEAVWQVLALHFEWGGASYVRYCGGCLSVVEGAYIVGCTMRQSYLFEGGAIGIAAPSYPKFA